MPVLVKELAQDFELVVCDLPAAGQASCTSRLAGLLDGVLLVVESERVCCEAAERGKELLMRADAQLLGVVLNKRRQARPNGCLADDKGQSPCSSGWETFGPGFHGQPVFVASIPRGSFTGCSSANGPAPIGPARNSRCWCSA